MKHLILGTAGHVDHGKTAIVKALTGFDCDTHKEEKRRGITINLGFTHLLLPSGEDIGVIDVPGHRDFIHTMVGGASGIDIAMLVVAADGGVMPQTREHVEIMNLLGIKTGIIALTRIDLASIDVAELAEEEIKEFVRGTFLENAPVIKVSAVTGQGIDELKKVISETAAQIADRPLRENFRMYIDRIFSVSGFGTVVNGSVLGGSIRTGDTAYLMPSGQELRVRRIEHHGHEVTEAFAGDRASLNLAGLSRDDFVRGMMVAGKLLNTTSMLDARLSLFVSGRRLPLWSNALFLIGTFEAQVRIHLIDRDSLSPGDSAIVQIHLPLQCSAQHGDRFVIRSTSGDITLGGGEVIDAAPLHHRRRPKELVEKLEKLAGGDSRELIATEIRKQLFGVSAVRLAGLLNMALAEILDVLGELPEDILVETISRENLTYCITAKASADLAERCKKILEGHHRKNPLLEEGKTSDELYGMLGIKGVAENHAILRHQMDLMTDRGLLRQVGRTWALAGHKPDISGNFKKHISSVEDYIINCGMQVPLYANLVQDAVKNKIPEDELKQILKYLIGKGSVYLIDGNYLSAGVVDKVRKKLLQKLIEEKNGITVALFRDLIDGNRKICLLLYALFDSEGLTQRNGDFRVITEKGRQRLDVL